MCSGFLAHLTCCCPRRATRGPALAALGSYRCGSARLPMPGANSHRIWKIPPKINFFLWLLTNDAVLTKDNLIKRKCNGDPRCVFCDSNEDISHLFFQCPIARVIWSIVAKCFGANNIPSRLNQNWQWCEVWLPYGKKFYPWGIAAIC